jgi:hypothetical protein
MKDPSEASPHDSLTASNARVGAFQDLTDAAVYPRLRWDARCDAKDTNSLIQSIFILPNSGPIEHCICIV